MSSVTKAILNNLGVQLWQPNTQIIGAKQDIIPFTYGLLQNGNCVGYLYTTQDASNNKQWPEVEQLLNAIAAALKLEFKFIINEFNFIADANIKFVLVMGLMTAQLTLATQFLHLGDIRGQALQDKNYPVPVLVTEHGFKLVQNPAEKRQVWQDVQVILKICG